MEYRLQGKWPKNADIRDRGHKSDVAAFARERLSFRPDQQQTELLSKPRRRVLLNCTRQWGKSTITAVKAVHQAYFCPGCLVLVATPSTRQSGEFLRRVAGFMRKLELPARGDGNHPVSVLFPNGSRIIGLPGLETAVRGFSSVSLLLVDDAARVGDDLYRAVRPTLAVGGGELWLMSTPFGKRGFFWEEWADPTRHWERVTVPSTECPRISKRFLAEERISLGDRWFRQEYLCEFMGPEESLFRPDVLDDAVSEELEPLFRR